MRALPLAALAFVSFGFKFVRVRGSISIKNLFINFKRQTPKHPPATPRRNLTHYSRLNRSRQKSGYLAYFTQVIISVYTSHSYFLVSVFSAYRVSGLGFVLFRLVGIDFRGHLLKSLQLVEVRDQLHVSLCLGACPDRLFPWLLLF